MAQLYPLRRFVFVPANLLLAVLFLVGLPLGRADSITLQDGTVLEGKILQVNDKEVIIETRFSETISEAQRYSRSEVRQIQKQSDDQLPFDKLAAVPLPESALVPGDYDEYLQKRQQFLTDYAYSPKVSEVRAQMRAAQKEQERVAGGAVKLEGRWLSEEEMEKAGFEIGARKLLAEISQLERRGELVRALNQFALLEKQYGGSAIYPQAVETAKSLMMNLNRILDHEERNFPITEAKREEGIALSSAVDQQQMRAARQRELDQFEGRAAAALAAGDKFPPYLGVSPESIKKLRTVLASEQSRLGALPLDVMQKSLDLTKQGQGFLGRGDIKAAEVDAAQAIELWKDNQGALRLQEQVKKELARREAANSKTEGTLGQPQP